MLSAAKSAVSAATTLATRPSIENRIPINRNDIHIGTVLKNNRGSGLFHERELYLRQNYDDSSLIWAEPGKIYGRGMIENLNNHILFKGEIHNENPDFLYKIVNKQNNTISLSFKLKPYTGGLEILNKLDPIIDKRDADFHPHIGEIGQIAHLGRTKLGGKKKRKKRKSKKNRKTNKRRKFSKKLK